MNRSGGHFFVTQNHRSVQDHPNGVKALKGLTLTIGNHMFGLLGPNGAGKSTLMRTVATLQDPDSGTVLLDDLNVLTQKTRYAKFSAIYRRSSESIPRCRRWICFTISRSSRASRTKTERTQMVEALLQQTNLWDARKKSLSTYSGGMKQRFGIAQALLANPKLIIVDEPTAGLDPAERNRFLNL
jgi:ABC-2 type transport system ATP-binding protein